ncbi:LysM peptidoglycan-binding domain-containing protein [Flavobacterium sp. SUN046]|uniref:LysM peptidoglycan-binding domain-containing protein n=1 Tax=Flavobacterium sp. SUN046 TaxID=3002440 RepID=UPI002DBF8F62|nr:LysM peptidoglycan-binding domain-containing protein [Flavobacterium sp. SUN046]MEC4048154.1 LysM peptidoglycan-binding domain-containing protein [Flavobacterium sp. SUN046]
MRIKNKFTALLLIATSSFYAQEVVPSTDSIIKNEVKISFLDSIKKTFVHYEGAERIDSLWMKELSVLNQYDDMVADIAKMDINQKVDYELPTELLKERLKKLDEKSPFNIEYNEGLENIIKSFLKNRKRSFERLMGISQYYFPMFEEALAKHNVPLEIKYLAVVESALKPKVVSRAGATGLWQFMFDTGRQYGLKIDSYVDERSNELKSSDAAARYMQRSYEALGDWEMVLASYNSGLGNVSKAIRRSGGHQNYWNVRKYLPKETQGYVPAFLATMYIFEYHKEHGIVPDKAIANHFATDTVAIKGHLTFKEISDLLDMPISELEYFNPAYKRNEIPYITGETHYLRMPKDRIAVFTSNEDKIYAYAKYEDSKRERPNDRLAVAKAKNGDLDKEFVTKTQYHILKKGDNLSEISDQFGVSISDLKRWNRIKGKKLPYGKNLKIYVSERVAKTQTTKDSTAAPKDPINGLPKETNTSVAFLEPKPTKTFKTEKVVTYKDVTKTYKVKSGDNLGVIADKNNVTVAEIKKWNHLKSDNISLGKNLKIISNEKVTTIVKKEIKGSAIAKNEDEPKEIKNNKSDSAKNKNNKEDNSITKNDSYTVAAGENLSTIAKKNKIALDDLKAWNNLSDNNVKAGTQLVLSRPKNSKNADADSIEYTVVKGDNMSTIAKKNNTTVDKIKEWNNLEDSNVIIGAKLIVGKEDNSKTYSKSNKENLAVNSKKDKKEKLYQVKRGDSLFSISQKFPGVTIADIKKWNNIKDGSIHPGMKLKING